MSKTYLFRVLSKITLFIYALYSDETISSMPERTGKGDNKKVVKVLGKKGRKLLPLALMILLVGGGTAIAAWAILKATTPVPTSVHTVATGEFSSAYISAATQSAYSAPTQLPTFNDGHTTGSPTGGKAITSVSTNFDITRLTSINLKIKLTPKTGTNGGDIAVLPTDSSWNPVLYYGFASVTTTEAYVYHNLSTDSGGAIPKVTDLVWGDTAMGTGTNLAPAWTKTASEWSTTITISAASIAQPDGMKSLLFKQINNGVGSQPTSSTWVDKNCDGVFLWLDENITAFDTFANWGHSIALDVTLEWSASG